MESSLARRFWAKIARGGENDCWEWTACLDNSGYGKIACGSRGAVDRAHRVSYRLHAGPIPDGALVLHTCDNRKCVNPRHLFLGTIQDNMKDMMTKHRQAKGEAKWTAVLSADQVVELRERHARGETLAKLGPEYGVTVKQASSIACGDSWAHVGGPRRERRKFRPKAPYQ